MVAGQVVDPRGEVAPCVRQVEDVVEVVEAEAVAEVGVGDRSCLRTPAYWIDRIQMSQTVCRNVWVGGAVLTPVAAARVASVQLG